MYLRTYKRKNNHSQINIVDIKLRTLNATTCEMEEVNSFTQKEVCERWQSQPVNEDQWGEMSKEMQDALEQENKTKNGLEKETKMQKSSPASDEVTTKCYHAMQKECCEWQYYKFLKSDDEETENEETEDEETGDEECPEDLKEFNRYM